MMRFKRGGEREKGPGDPGPPDGCATQTLPREEETERMERRRRRARRLLFSGIFVAGTFIALFGEDGLVDRLRYRSELNQMQAEASEQQARVAKLAREVERLRSDPIARERIAREKLGFAEPGEFVYILPDATGTEDQLAPDDNRSPGENNREGIDAP